MKQITRDQIKALLKRQTIQTQQDAAKNLLVNLQPLLDKATHIAVYHAYGYELKLDNVIDYCIANNKQLYQPLTYKDLKCMSLIRYDVNHTGIFASPEFVLDNGYEWYNLDLILLPLLAVDKFGFRLGKGGGYYDTTLANLQSNKSRPILCGVGFATQLLDHVPHDVWDIRLDYFVSGQQLIKF